MAATGGRLRREALQNLVRAALAGSKPGMPLAVTAMQSERQTPRYPEDLHRKSDSLRVGVPRNRRAAGASG